MERAVSETPAGVLVFDLDGTLVDTSGDIVFSANHLRERVGLAPLPGERVLAEVGHGAPYLVERLVGPAGAGSLATVVNAAMGNKARFDRMKAFFEGVGTGYATGVWQEVPTDRPQFKHVYAKKLAKARAAEEAIGE